MCVVQVLRSLGQMHMAKAKSHCAYLKHENALVMWDADISLLASTVRMVSAVLTATPTTDGAAFNSGKGCTAVGASSAASEKDGHRRRRQRLLAVAGSLFASACACFVVMGITVRHFAELEISAYQLSYESYHITSVTVLPTS